MRYISPERCPAAEYFKLYFTLHSPGSEINIYWLYIVICKTHNCVQLKQRNRVCGGSEGGRRAADGGLWASRAVWAASPMLWTLHFSSLVFYSCLFLFFHSLLHSTLIEIFCSRYYSISYYLTFTPYLNRFYSFIPVLCFPPTSSHPLTLT